jgi:uncharacterized protein (TIGR03492 family)
MTQNDRHVLFISNGNGEDEIACRVIAALRRIAPKGLILEAWPMVGLGAAYRALSVPVKGPANLLPGEGFGTLSFSALFRDLQAGFIATHLNQARHARAQRGRHDLLVGVGDVVPLASGWLARTPMAFIACAKTAYYGGVDGHMPLERHLMRKGCVEVFPRDKPTMEGLVRKGVSATYLGNPMMDDLPPPPSPLIGPDRLGIALLPGSRGDATRNAAFLLTAAGIMTEKTAPQPLSFLIACHPRVEIAEVISALSETVWRPAGDDDLPPGSARLVGPNGAEALLLRQAFAAVLHSSALAVGMAGTANEQASGLGLPLITAAGAGNQGEAYLRMKMRYFGNAAIATPRDPAAIAAAMASLLADPARRAVMSAEGRKRMGAPGASAAIAAALVARLAQIAPRALP